MNIKKFIESHSVFWVFIFVLILYFSSHLVNFSTAPWNQNGLFDDAAWDIYFAKNHVFNGLPFQAAFFDEVGFISREVVFHYYISVFFKLFGYNLLVFNISLLMLGFITVLFTTLIVHKLFKNILITAISAIIINFLPLHFLHVFAGHRYAIAAPLMVISLYYLYAGFIDKSRLKIVISGFSAALCLSSAVMGKQYIYGLILSAIFLLLNKKRPMGLKNNFTLIIIWIVSFVLSASPLLYYIIQNGSLYTIRESSLIHDFYQNFHKDGGAALFPYFDQAKEVFFAERSYRRWFLPDFYPIPITYYIFIIPGLFFAWFKKRYEIVFLALIPIAGAFVAGTYDFRILLAAPIWIISMAFTLNFLINQIRGKSSALFITAGIIMLFLGVFSSIKYLWSISKDPNSLWLLPHKDVAVSRLVQDIAAGVKNPTSSLKWNEFDRKTDPASINHDLLVCPLRAYAIMHLYLQDFNDKKILSFINQGTQYLATPEEILSFNVQAIANYVPTNKDLKMIWEVSEKTEDVIKIFSGYNKYGNETVLSDSADNIPFSLYILTIYNENLSIFKKDVTEKYINGKN